MKISKEMIKEGLTALGIKPGMKLMVHSSLKSFGEVEDGADTVLDALFEVVNGNKKAPQHVEQPKNTKTLRCRAVTFAQ